LEADKVKTVKIIRIINADIHDGIIRYFTFCIIILIYLYEIFIIS